MFDVEPGHTWEQPRLAQPATSQSNSTRSIGRPLRHPAVLDIVSQPIGPAFSTNGDKLNMKLANVGSPVEWHQDWAFYPHTNDDLLAVGVAMDDLDGGERLPLVIPGSHKGRIYDHNQ